MGIRPLCPPVHRSSRPVSTSGAAVGLLPGLWRGQYSTIAQLAQQEAAGRRSLPPRLEPFFGAVWARPVSDVSARPLDVCFAPNEPTSLETSPIAKTGSRSRLAAVRPFPNWVGLADIQFLT